MPPIASIAAVAPAVPDPTGSKPSVAALQAQLQRYQQQLADCVNCASASTVQGKVDIAALAARIGEVRQRIAEATKAVDAAAPTPGATASAVDTPSPAVRGTGGLIDVYA